MNYITQFKSSPYVTQPPLYFLPFLFCLFINCTTVFAQPRSITHLDDNTYFCDGQIKLRFNIGDSNGRDEYITRSDLFIQYGNGPSYTVFKFNHNEVGLNCPTRQSLNNGVDGRDFLWCSPGGTPNGEYVSDLILDTRGSLSYIEITIENVLGRNVDDVNFILEYDFIDDGPDLTDEVTRLRIDDRPYINSNVLTAFRDDCNPNDVNLTVNANIGCAESGFYYLLDIDKADNPEFNNSTKVVTNERINTTNLRDNLSFSYTDLGAGTTQFYYRSVLRYIRNSPLLRFADIQSNTTPIQSFSIVPPTLNEISSNLCENEIQLDWSYNAQTPSSFDIYRTDVFNTTLNFQNSYLAFDDSQLRLFDLESTDPTLQVGAWVKINDPLRNQIIVHRGRTNEGESGFSLGIKNGKVNAQVFAPDANNPSIIRQISVNSGDIPPDTWVHIRLFFSPRLATTILVNGEITEVEGELTGQVTFPIYNPIDSLYIGAANYDQDLNYFDGAIDDLTISTAFPAEDFRRRIDPENEPNLLFYLDFEEGTPLKNNQGLTQVTDKKSGLTASLETFNLQGVRSNFSGRYAEIDLEKIATVVGTESSYTDNDRIISNTPYFYVLKANTTCNNVSLSSIFSNPKSGLSPTIPIAPSNLRATPNQEDNTVILEWTDNAFSETGFIIERTSSGSVPFIFNVPADSTRFIDTNPAGCTEYTYTVRTQNVCGTSNQAAQVYNVLLEPNLSQAIVENSFAAGKGYSSTRVDLSWAISESTANLIDRFRIFRKQLGEQDSVQIDVISGNTNVYRDNIAEPGFLYEYTVIGEADCASGIITSNIAKSVGFRTATGLVNGQVTFAGNTAVEDARILVNRIGEQSGNSLAFDGSNDYIGDFETVLPLQNTSFTLEFWVNKAALGREEVIFSQGDMSLVDFQQLFFKFNANDQASFGFSGTGNSITTSNNYTGDINQWHHWACIFDNTNLQGTIYRDGELVATGSLNGNYNGNEALYIGRGVNGNYFQGNIDELRVWNIVKEETTIARDYNRQLNNDATGLLMTLGFEEGIGTEVYDRSRTGVFFNGRHGRIYGQTNIQSNWSDNIPSEDQLSLSAYTDENGNYIINSIPYFGPGQNFRVVPQFGTHEFSPSQTVIFIGNGAEIHNNVDFMDISSFPVTGTVFYEGTSCPAGEIEVQVDGVTALVNGEKVMTDNMGFFTVDVPIGEHRVSLFKEGHEFSVGQFPTDGSLFDFQEPVSGLEFMDATQLTIVGRVVGGIQEGNKVPALGRSVNNIGRARIIFSSVAGNGCHQDTVFTNSQTGEYTIALYPLEYTIEDIRVTNPAQNISTSHFGVLPLLDLVDEGTTQTAKDTVYIGNTNIIERIDSVQYNVEQNFIYRNEAEVIITQEDGVSPFIGEQSLTVNNAGVESTIDLVNNPSVYPIFRRGNTYRGLISAFERYQNFDVNAPITEDRVPVTDGELIIANNLADEATEQQNFTIDLIEGDTLFTFIAGLPNLLQDEDNPEYSFTETMDVTLRRPGQISDVKWYPNNGLTLEQRIFRGYVLGFQAIEGSNFVTQGPQKVDFVLRDPPGSNSTASITTETSITQTHSFTLAENAGLGVSQAVQGGASFSVGLGLSTNTNATIRTGGGFELNVASSQSGSFETTTTHTQGYSTNGNPEAVGARSDVYVGTSLNLNFGVTNELEILSNEACNLPSIECVDFNPSLPFQIGKRVGFYATPSDQITTFAYDHNFIVNYLIPNLQELRNNLFQSVTYTANIATSEERFGLNNDDEAWAGSRVSTPAMSTEAADRTGPSYTWNGNVDDYGIGTDSVRWYNQQIRLWEETLAMNEEDKVRAMSSSDYQNELISFNAGSTISRGTESSGTDVAEWEIEVATSGEFRNTVEAVAGGNGFMAENSFSIGLSIAYGGEQATSETTSWEYELNDEDQGDVIQTQVYNSPQGWGPIFQTIGGQTACPHEDEVVTEYFEPGTVISNRTLRRTDIGLDIFPSIVQNVPDGEEAVFTVRLQNLSETFDGNDYAIQVDPTSNPNGLIVSMDGTNLAIPRMVTIEGGSISERTITVRRGAELYNYEDIRLVAFVPCQYERGTSDEEDLADIATFSVSFLPNCTNVNLREPEDLWVVNNFNNDSLQVTIDDYDINQPGLEFISLQYRPASESRWTELQKWWHPINKADEDGEKIPTDRSFIRYFWEMGNFPDGNYHLRTVSQCELAQEETIFHQGYADRINPHAFGTPVPGDGILSPNEDLKVQFNETVDIGSINLQNFDIRGVLNGSDIRHQESIQFDGQNDYLNIPGYDLIRRSFSFEFWAKQNSTGGEQIILSQSEIAAQQLRIGFNANNRLFLEVNNQTVIANNATTDTDWHHYTIVYDRTQSDAHLYIDGRLNNSNNNFNTEYSGGGDIIVGRQASNAGNAFRGNIHELRLWSSIRTEADITIDLNKRLSGREVGLIGYWEMNEAIGNVANDKVRGRHATLNNASWSITPSGAAFTFNGTSDYLSTTAGAPALNDEMDMTIEFWFKGNATGTPMTVLSNGESDGSTTQTTAWSIAFDENGRIVVENNAQIFSTQQGGYLDNNWHHYAFVLRRNASVKAYVDGTLVNTGNANNWLGFGGPRLWLGAKGQIAGGGTSINEHFNGSLDEVRIWNTARMREQIARDRVNRQIGDEMGLIAYYPFDRYELDAGVPVLRNSLTDESMNDWDLIQGGSTGLNYSTETPPIKLARPIEKVNFTYSVNNDEIILTPTDPAARIENVTLDITVTGIRDLSGNRLQSPITWIAYFDKNQVNWMEERVTMSQPSETSSTFSTNLQNTGGSREYFEISNIPDWLTAIPSSGWIEPNSTLPIEFRIDDKLENGNYEQDIFVTTDFGYNERFTLELTVESTPPPWAVESELFEFSMSYIGELNINGALSVDENDLIAAFIGDEIRGLTNVVYDERTGKYLIFLDVYSDEVIGSSITFSIWDASTGKIHSEVTPNDETFEVSLVKGTRNNPIVFSTANQFDMKYILNRGWNWVSFPLNTPRLANINTVFEDLSPTMDYLLASQTGVEFYSGDATTGWAGTISISESGLNVESGYRLFVSKPDTFSYSGVFESPSLHPIDLNTGWNWIGFIAQNNIDLTTALASLNPSEGDVIKGQSSFALFEEGLGWGGSLRFLEPSESYRIRMNQADQLIYPDVALGGLQQGIIAQSRSNDPQLVLEEKVRLDRNDFAASMSMILDLDLCDINNQLKEEVYIAALDGQTIQGIAPIEMDEQVGASRAYLTVFGNEPTNLHFQLLYGDDLTAFELTEQVTFEDNKVVGMLSAPMMMTSVKDCETLQAELGVFATSTENLITDIQFSYYPNPFTDNVTFEITLPQASGIQVKLMDSQGKMIIQEHLGNFTAGQQKIGLTNQQRLKALPQGIYLVEVSTDFGQYQAKLVK